MGSNIIFILDDRVSREKMAIVTRVVNQLRTQFTIELFKGEEINEAQLIQKLEKQSVPLILAPIHRYTAWTKVEGFLGMNRNSGPTFAGYFCEPVSQNQVPQSAGQIRKIFLDFLNLNPPELQILIRSIVNENQRSGVRSLVQPNTLVHCETWYGGQGQGSRIDYILTLSEISLEWSKRANEIRILLSAFWSLIYEEGPGKSETPSKTPKAYFQICADPNILALRLCYSQVGHVSPKDVLNLFWPNPSTPTKATQLLYRFSDFVRIHPIGDTPEIEIVVGLFKSAPSEKFPEQLHTLWIDPISPRLVLEPLYEGPNPNSPQLRVLPNVSAGDLKPRLTSSNELPDKARNRVLVEATQKIKSLKDQISEKENTIRELRSGGIGTAQPLPPPDAESLLDAFQQRYMDAKLQIRQFETQIEAMEKNGSTPQEIQNLRLKMEALLNREKAWIKKLLATVELFKAAQKKPKNSG